MFDIISNELEKFINIYKMRHGFMLNFLDVNYNVNLKEYPNVFSVAKAMIELIVFGKEKLYTTSQERDREFGIIELELLEQSINNKIDQNSSLFIFNTIIIKKENQYNVITNFDYPFMKLKGFTTVKYFKQLDIRDIKYYFLCINKFGTQSDYKSELYKEFREKNIELFKKIVANEKANSGIDKSDMSKISKLRDEYIKIQFKINEHITLKLENTITMIYVKNKRFRQCLRLVINIPVKEFDEFDDIDSIDEAPSLSKKVNYETSNEHFYISPKEEFWGHCSNLQAWAENNYDTRVLHSNLSFPLLKELNNLGDPIAQQVFKDEIAQRLDSGFLPVIFYLLTEDYLQYLNVDEQKNVLYNLLTTLNLNPKLENLMYFLFSYDENKKLNLNDIKSKDIYNFLNAFILDDMFYWPNLYNLLKIVFSNKNLRTPFLNLLKNKKDNEQYDVVIPLFKTFIYHSNEKEINLIFNESLPIFLEIFYDLTINNEFGSDYNEFKLREHIGKSISNLIKSKIQMNVEKNDLTAISQIYRNSLFDCLNEQDLISVFNHKEINFIKFLLDRVKDLSKYDSFNTIFFITDLNKKVADYISDSIMEILPNYSFKKHNDPLLTLGFFECLNKKHIKILIKDFNIDYLKSLGYLTSQFYIHNDVKYEKKRVNEKLEKIGLSVKKILLLCLKETNVYEKIYEYRLLELLTANDIKSLINDVDLNFIENFLLMYHDIFIKKENEIYPILDLFPEFFRDQESEFLKKKIKDMIKQKNLRIFFPLYASNLTFFFSNEEICSMIKDKDINLLELVLTTLDRYSNKLYIDTNFIFDINKTFFKIVRINIKPTFILDLLHRFLEIDFSPLFRFRIFEKLDYVDLIPIFKHKDFFKSFLHSLNKFVYSFKVLFTHHNKCIEYYRKIWPYLLINSPDVLQLNNFELYLEIDPYILFDLKILECFGISFTIALLEKAKIWYFQRFFRDLQKLVSSATISTFNDEFIKEIIPFLHIVGKYLTSTIKEKILEFLENYLHTELSWEQPLKNNYFKEEIGTVYSLFYLRWNLFFKSHEIIKLQKILKKNNLLINYLKYKRNYKHLN